MRFYWRWQQMAFVAIIVLWGLFKLNLLSAGWNIVVGLVITAVLFILTGFIGNDLPEPIRLAQSFAPRPSPRANPEFMAQ